MVETIIVDKGNIRAALLYEADLEEQETKPVRSIASSIPDNNILSSI